jgi:hypothetical protein
MVNEGGGLERFLRGKRSGTRASSNISQVVKHFVDFIEWFYGNIFFECLFFPDIYFVGNNGGYEEQTSITKFLEKLLVDDFMYLRNYSDNLCEAKILKAATIRTILMNIGHCLKWFAVYVLKDASKLMSGIILQNSHVI